MICVDETDSKTHLPIDMLAEILRWGEGSLDLHEAQT